MRIIVTLCINIIILLFIFIASAATKEKQLLKKEFIDVINTYKIENEWYIMSVQYINYESKIKLIIYSKQENIIFTTCKVKYKDYEELCNPLKVYNSFLLYIYDISTKPNSLPNKLSLNNITISIPMSKRNKDYKFISCNAVMSNFDRPLMLIELIESNIYFGTSKIVFYYYSTSYKVKQILKYYSDIGVVDVYKYDTDSYLKNEEKRKETTSFHLNYFKLNHCFNEYKTENNHMIFLDLDEILWPVKSQNYEKMIHSIPKKGIYFINAYFYKTDFEVKNEIDKSEEKPLPDVDIFSVKKYCPTDDGYVHKFIILDTNEIVAVDVHDSISKSNYKREYISNKIAFIRHTRHFNTGLKDHCPNSFLINNSINIIESKLQNISIKIYRMFS